jgi:Ca2+-binding EF-hand superfamily protein
MMGDINGDGIIDYRDINKVAMAFGSTPGHPRWSPDGDLNRDGVVDMRDMFIVAKRFGQTC